MKKTAHCTVRIYAIERRVNKTWVFVATNHDLKIRDMLGMKKHLFKIRKQNERTKQKFRLIRLEQTFEVIA